MAFDVYVVNENGDPKEGVKVGIFPPLISLSTWQEEYTNENGHAEFNDDFDHEVEVFLDGKSYGRYHYKDGAGITLTYTYDD